MQYKLFCLFCFLGSCLAAYSYSFSENNAEGKPVYYTITSAEENTVEIAWPKENTGYSGVFSIPETVVHEGIEYQVTGIGESAFNPSTVTEIHVPGSIRVIGKKAFYNCATVETIILPDQLTRIEEEAFSNCTALKTITLPETVEEIGKNAFRRCDNLTSVRLPGSLSQIGEKSFYSCEKLRVLELSEGLTHIGKQAFYGTSLASVTIPSSVTAIGEGAFGGCFALKSIAVDEKSPYFCTENGILLNHSKELLHTWPGGNTDYSTFPQSVTQINGYAFYALGLSSFTIPEGVISIGELAFASNRLTFVSLPGTLQSMSSTAFNSSFLINHVVCKAINVPSTGNSGPTFGSYTREDTVVFEVPQQSIAAYEKAWSHGKFIPLGATLLQVELDEAGTLAQHLNAETLLTTFRMEITGPVNGSDVITLKKMKNLLELDLANATLVSGGDPYEYQLNGAVKEKVYTQNNCISAYLFWYISSKLRKVVLPPSIVSIDNGAFYNCEIDSIEIPAGVTHIGSYAFKSCRKLRSVQIPENVEFTGGYVFQDCVALQEVVFERGTSALPHKIFENCTSLSHVILPEGLKVIGSEAFLNCTNLPALSLPESVETIGNWCLDKCTSLRRLEVRNPVPYAASSSTFYGVPVNACTLYVPAASLSSYKEAEYWKQFGAIEPLEDDPSSLESTRNNEQTDALTVISIPGGFTLVSEQPQEVRIHDLSGSILTRLLLPGKGTHTLYNLPQGIYLINGKKAVVK